MRHALSATSCPLDLTAWIVRVRILGVAGDLSIATLVGRYGKAHLVDWERLILHLLLYRFEILLLVLRVVVSIRLLKGWVYQLLIELWRVVLVIDARRG
jgi:hypothetical protein